MVVYCVSLIDKLPPQLIAMTSLFVAGLTVRHLDFAIAIFFTEPHLFHSTSMVHSSHCLHSQVASSHTMSLGWLAHAALFCVGYFGQDLSHYGTGEQTVLLDV